MVIAESRPHTVLPVSLYAFQRGTHSHFRFLGTQRALPGKTKSNLGTLMDEEVFCLRAC